MLKSKSKLLKTYVILSLIGSSLSRSAAAQPQSIDGISSDKRKVEIVLGHLHLKLPRIDIRFTSLDGDLPNGSVRSIDLVGTAPDLWGTLPTGNFDPGSKADPESMQALLDFIPGITSARTTLLPVGVTGVESQFGLKAYEESKVQDIIYTPSKALSRKIEIVCVTPVGNLEYCRLYTTYEDSISISITFDRKKLSEWRAIDQSVQTLLSGIMEQLPPGR